MDTKREDVVMASDITAAVEAVEKNQPTSDEVVAAIQDAEKRDALIDDPTKKFVFDPSKNPMMAAAAKKAMKEYLSRLPKHENYRNCQKKCPLFKECECFKKTVDQQKQCWDELIIALPRFAGAKRLISDCDIKCGECPSLKKCFALNKDIIKKEKEEAGAKESASDSAPAQ